MKAIEEYHRAVERGHEDNTRVGKCADRPAGIHSDDMDKVYPALGEVVQEVIDYFRRRGEEPSPRQILPIAEVGQNPFPCAETIDA